MLKLRSEFFWEKNLGFGIFPRKKYLPALMHFGFMDLFFFVPKKHFPSPGREESELLRRILSKLDMGCSVNLSPGSGTEKKNH